ncbi:MAG: L-threonylcarbamoyladenylate synthase [bacterium]
MEIIRLKSGNISAAGIKRIRDVLKNDGLVIFPTDTVYGLAGNAGSSFALEKIYKLKKRPKDKPFIIFVPDIDSLNKLKIKFVPKIKKLLNVFWPGAVTFIFRKIPLNPPFSKGERGGFKRSETIAVRIPGHPVVLAILKEFNGPLVVTSANISGKEAPIYFKQIDAEILKNTDIAVDEGICRFGVVSTIVDVSEKELKILREGAVPKEKIIEIWGELNGEKGKSFKES